jgi:four helix bundle protein
MVYTDLDAWKEARMFGLLSQIKRSAVSIPSNIAEGNGRQHRKDTLQFFYIAHGSAYELETQLYLSFDLNFLDQGSLDVLLKQLELVRRLLAGLINYYKSQLEKN